MLSNDELRNELLKAFIAGVREGCELTVDRSKPVDVKAPAFKYAKDAMERIYRRMTQVKVGWKPGDCE